MRVASRVCALLTPWLVACGPNAAPEPLATVQQGIVGGATDPSNDGVVALAVEQPGLFVGHCTGTLIAPNLVLTARHCVSPTVSTPDEQVVCGVAEFDGTGDPRQFLATPSTVRPLTADAPTFFRGQSIRASDESADVCGHDVALLVLEEPIPAALATPIAPRIDAPGSIGEKFSAEGYGYTDPTARVGDGTRMRLDGVSVRCTGDACSTRSDILRAGEWLSVDARLCPGDSGGAALDAEGRVMGVASRAGSGCTTAIYSDVAAFQELIIDAARAAATAGGYDAPPWTTGSSVLGTACRTDCSGGLACYSETGKPPGVCVPRCGGGGACPSGFTCSADVGACVPARAPVPTSGCTAVAGRGSGSSWLLSLVGIVAIGARRVRTPARTGVRRRPRAVGSGGVP